MEVVWSILNILSTFFISMVFLAGVEDRDVGIGFRLAFAGLTVVFWVVTVINIFNLWVTVEAI